MDNNQRQDWWPNNDKAPETDTSSGAEVHDSVQPHPEPDPVPHQIPEESGTEPETVPQENSYNTWNNPQGQTQDNPYNNWNNQQGQYQNNPYNNWNNQQGQYQNNPYNNWNNQQGQYQNTPYNNTPNRPPMRSNNGMAIASLVMGVLSIALICLASPISLEPLESFLPYFPEKMDLWIHRQKSVWDFPSEVPLSDFS